MKHPIQPTETDEHGVLRFKPNAIVRYLLDNGSIDLNDLAALDFSQDDREQFAQLIGYSISGYSELSYVSDDTCGAAAMMADDGYENSNEARLAHLEHVIFMLREALREPIAQLYGKHPDDLGYNA